MLRVSLIVMGLCTAMASNAAAEKPWLTLEDYGKLDVISSKSAKEATKVFAETWEACTGQKVETSDAARPGRIAVYIGRDAVPAELAKGIRYDALGTDGVYLASIPGSKKSGRALIITGGEPRGTVYAVYEFFERYMGVRWLTPEDVFIPTLPSREAPAADAKPWERRAPAMLPTIKYTHTPVFEYRRTMTPDKGDQKTFSDARKMTDGPGFGRGTFVHTAYGLLPPKVYGKEHPEYYSEIDGKRVVPMFEYDDPKSREKHPGEIAQLCFSNPAVADAITAVLRERMKADPKNHIWSVSQMDWGNYCQCAECRAIDEREGTPMGSLLTCVNRVADAIAAEFPDNYIETLAYTWSRHAPKHLRPRDNVIIRLCSIECDFARPLADPKVKENVEFAQDIREWSRIAKQLYIWDYTVNFSGYQRPHPNFQVLSDNVKFFAAHKVRGLFEQGVGAPRVEMGYLRPYLLTLAMWDPEADLDVARDEFIDLYYREAGPQVREYIELCKSAVLDQGWMMSTFDPAGWANTAFVEKAREILGRAQDAAASDEIRQRIAFMRVSVEFIAMACAPEVRIADGVMHVSRPQSLTPAEYIVLAKRFGISEYAENQPIAEYGSLPRQYQPRDMSSPIEALENENYLVWVMPKLEGSVLRWLDKRTNAELIQGFREYGGRAGTWQDWCNTPYREEGPVASEYRVVEKAAERLVLEATSLDGLLVRRTMVLRPGSDRIEVTLKVTNSTDAPKMASVKHHPEFYDQGGYYPEIWGLKNGEWTKLNAKKTVPAVSTGEYLKPNGFSKLAFRIPEKNVTVGCEFDAAKVGGLLWYYNSSNAAQQVNLEVLPPAKTLAPGESMELHAAYFASSKKPSAL